MKNVMNPKRVINSRKNNICINFIIGVLFLLLQKNELFSQKTTIDSLENIINTSLSDTTRIRLLNDLSKKLLFEGEYEKALHYSEQSKILSTKGITKSIDVELKNVFKKGLATSINTIGNYYTYKNNNPKALENYLNSLKISEDINDEKGISITLSNISRIYSTQSNYPQALKYAIKALLISENSQDKNAIAASRIRISYVYLNMGIYEKAIENGLKALEVGYSISDKTLIIDSYNIIGATYKNQGNYVKALENFISSLKIAEEINDEYGKRAALGNLGILYKYIGNYDLAIENYTKCLKMSEKVGDKSGIASSYNNIGIIYLTIADSSLKVNAKEYYKKSLEYELKAAQIWNSLDDQRGLADAYSNIGNVYESLADNIDVSLDDIKQKKNSPNSDYSKALEYYTKSLKIREKIGDKYGISNSNFNLGSVYLKNNQLAESYKYLSQSLNLSKELGIKIGVQEAFYLLTVLFEKKEDYKSALHSHREYTKYKDSILNDDNYKQLNNLQVAFETEKKEKEIQLLLKEKQLTDANFNKQKQLAVFVLLGILFSILISFLLYNRKQIKQKHSDETRKIQIEKQLLESQKKALQLQMNPHFIFNSLNTIQDFIASFNKEDALKYISKFSKLIRQILENSGSDKVLLSDEIKLLYLYLDLEVLRHDEKFDYKINVDPALDVGNPKLIHLIEELFHLPKDNNSS